METVNKINYKSEIYEIEDTTARTSVQEVASSLSDYEETTTASITALSNNLDSSVETLEGEIDTLSTSITEKLTTSSNLFKLMGNVIYPIGSIYLSLTNSNPSTIFGGGWEQLPQGALRNAVSASSYGSQVGDTSFTINANNLPQHTHSFTPPKIYIRAAAAGAAGATYYVPSNGGSYIFNDAAYSDGGEVGYNVTLNTPISYLPQSVNIYAWKRTSLFSE